MKRILSILAFFLLLTAHGSQLSGYDSCFTAHCSLLTSHYYDDDVVDCIAAVINNRVITLTDLKFMEAFGLFEDEIQTGSGDRLSLILEKVIDQRVILDMTREKIEVEPEEIDRAVSNLTQKLGEEEVQRSLSRFGARAEDLRACLEEKILCQKVISQRFSQGALVSLQEIELYYQTDYVPAQRQLGLEPEPMMQILNKIEALIREQKTSRQVSAWIKNLRAQAEIEIREECLKLR